MSFLEARGELAVLLDRSIVILILCLIDPELLIYIVTSPGALISDILILGRWINRAFLLAPLSAKPLHLLEVFKHSHSTSQESEVVGPLNGHMHSIIVAAGEPTLAAKKGRTTEKGAAKVTKRIKELSQLEEKG